MFKFFFNNLTLLLPTLLVFFLPISGSAQSGSVDLMKNEVQDITSSSAAIVYETSNSARTQIQYGTNPNALYHLGRYSSSFPSGKRRETITNLEPATTYYYSIKVRPKERRARSFNTAVKTFKTLDSTVTTAPPTTTTITIQPTTSSTSSTTTSSTTTTSPTPTEPASSGYRIPAKSPLRVFPGAEGFGTETAAGRGGVICKVTNLNASGSGSFRHCVEDLSGPRIVIFEVGGVITVEETIEIVNPNVSIYGQTALGDGIVISSGPKLNGAALSIDADDVLMQHIRVRASDSTLYGSSRDEGTSCCRDAFNVTNANNVVIDHNSFSWGTDEIAGTWYDVNNITWSYNIFAEGLHDAGVNSKGPAGRGLLIGNGTEAGNISIHHNLIANSYQRNPKIKVGGVVDIVNNLVSHWESRAGGHDGRYGGTANWVKNKWIAGPESSSGWGGLQLAETFSQMAYFEDNLGLTRTSHDSPQWSIARTGYNEDYDPSLGYHSNTRFSAPAITEMDVDDLESLLPPDVGATLPRRDSVDRRLVNELKDGTGRVPDCVSPNARGGSSGCSRNVGGFPSYSGGTPAKDSDDDGIPDRWEVANGTDPNVYDSTEDSNKDGYLNIEDWVHSIESSN